MEKKKSIGVNVLAIIFMYFGIWGIYKLVAEIIWVIKNKVFLVSDTKFMVAVWGIPFVCVLFLLAGIGIFRLNNIARRFAIFLSIATSLLYNIQWVGLILELHKILSEKKMMAKAVIIICGINLFFAYAIYFLTCHKVKEQFK